VRALVWVNVVCNACLTVPVVVAAFLFADATGAEGAAGLLVLIGLLASHKLGASTYRVANTTLQRDLISRNRKETATILSLGGALKNFVIVCLVFFGLGTKPASLLTWSIPSLAVVLVTLLMVVAVRPPRPVEEKVEEKVEAPAV
jgi:hypothetical protein